MSRIGNQPILIPAGVTVKIEPLSVSVTGPGGHLSVSIPDGITVSENSGGGGVLTLKSSLPSSRGSALHGLSRALLSNAITGVSVSWKKELEISGVGYRALMNGRSLTLTVGFSHPVIIDPPEGITISTSENKIIITGIDKQAVGQIASDIRKIKPPEPYKGKGLRYVGEKVRRKAGKTAKGVGAGK